MKTFEVYPQTTLAHLQLQFSERFPYLQIALGGDGNESETSTLNETIDELTSHQSHSCFLIEGDMSVTELETDFRDCFGLVIHVNRWTGYTWHDTDDTRHWTLDEQNQKGAEATLPSLATHR